MSVYPDASTDSLHDALREAGPGLVGNDALLAAVLSGSGDCIKILDLEGRLQFMSEGGKRVMEVDDFSLIKGCPWPDLWADEGNLAARQAVEDARNGKTARFLGGANTARGNAKFWDVRVMPIRDADGKPTHLLSISTDITEQQRAEQQQIVLGAELQHRIKNILAMVSAIAVQTLRGEDIADRRTAFSARLHALAQAQDLLTAKSWKGAPMRAVIEGALVPHISAADSFVLDGDDVDLSAKQALSLALTIHELATNAAKYGATSRPGGKVDIRWGLERSLGEDAVFKFIWRESGGPAVSIPAHTGFGTRLITRVLSADFDGHVRIDYEPGGVVCILTSPANSVLTDNPTLAETVKAT